MYKKNIVLGMLIVCLIGTSLVLIGCQSQGLTKGGNEKPSSVDEEEVKAPEPIDLSIVAVGDIIIHQPQLAAQYDKATDTYNFENNFQYVKKYIETADLAICNVETTFAGKEREFTGYPVFNTPDSLATTLKNTGFDVGVTANNHDLDRGSQGMLRTIDVLSDAGIVVAGTHKEGSQRYAMTTVKGVKVAVVAYTYETPRQGGRRSINAVPIPESMLNVVNSFGYETMEEDTTRILADIREAKSAGAEVIIAFMHWGREYAERPSTEDQKLAKAIADEGADIIFGSHPHVLQPIEMIKRADGKSVPVYYSLGNFISNQRLDTVDNRKTEDGIIGSVKITVMRQPVSGTTTKQGISQIGSIEAQFLPTWVNRYKRDGKRVYEVVPIIGDYKSNPSIIDSKSQTNIEESEKDTLATMASVPSSAGIITRREN